VRGDRRMEKNKRNLYLLFFFKTLWAAIAKWIDDVENYIWSRNNADDDGKTLARLTRRRLWIVFLIFFFCFTFLRDAHSPPPSWHICVYIFIFGFGWWARGQWYFCAS
jgi:protein-S-isoprenylcysteine O-methyltransferase Ste14